MKDSLPPEMHAELKESLVDAIQQFFDEKLTPADDHATATVIDRKLQLATAVLMLEVARCDFDARADEFVVIRDAVQRILGISADESEIVLRFAEEEVRQSKRLYQFTRLIDEGYTAEQKKTVVRYLWQVAFSDSRFVASEEYLIRKVADLLHVPLADFLDAKITARDAFR